MLRTLLKVVGVGVLLVAGLVGWIAYRAHSARTRVHAFCNAAKVGQPSTGLAERARAAGLQVHQLPAEGNSDPRAGTLLCIDGVMLARHICEIQYSDQRVTSARVSFVD